MVFELRDLVIDTMGRLVEGVRSVARTFLSWQSNCPFEATLENSDPACFL